MAPVPFSTVVVRFTPHDYPPDVQDMMNRAIMDRVNETGEFFLSHTVLNQRTCLRVALGNLRTRWEHLERLWELLTLTDRDVVSGLAGS